MNNNRAAIISGVAMVVMLSVAAHTARAEILNPFHTEPTWKLWYEDPAPPAGITPPPIANWLFPDDADTITNPGRFLAYRKGADWPQRKYAGFWYDVYSSQDGAHSYIRSSWSGDFGNTVALRSPDSHMHRTGTYAPLPCTATNEWNTYGVIWTSQSTTNMGHDLTDSFYDIDSLERNCYFANILRSGPAHISYIDNDLFYSADLYDALVPVFYDSIGSSGSETMALTKLLIAGGYLPRDLKPELLRNGLLQTAMFYIWKAGLPYKVPYEHELRHRVAYISYGDGTNNDYSGSNISQVGAMSYRYDPTEHLANMVAMAKDMYLAPPVALLKKIDITGGTEKSVNKTVIRVWQGVGETVQVRVSVEDSFDLQGLPMSYRWKVLNGNKDTTVQYEGNSTYLITVPPNDTLPKGRTVVTLVASNGFYDSNPATVNVYRTGGATNNLRVPPVTGLDARTILPGESVSYTLNSRDPEGFPVSFAQWDGVGKLDGNVFTWDSANDTQPGVYPVRIAASDGVTGNGMNGGESTITVSDTVAEITADVTAGAAPLTVNFSSAGSRDSNGGVSNIVWNFDDGSTSTAANPVHQFTQPGIYEVKLSVDGTAGTQAAHQVIEVRNNWPLGLDNGWSLTGGVDPAVWNVAGTVAVNSGSSGTRLTISGGAAGAPAGVTSVQGFARPLYIEALFRRPTFNQAAGSGMLMHGSLLGYPKGVTTRYFQQYDMSIGHATEGNPSVWTTQYVGPHLRIPRVVSELRVYIEDDPNNPGKVRYRGYVDADLGRYFIKFDNQDPGESWYDNLLGIVSEDGGSYDIWRYQVFTPTGGVSGPEINVEGERGQNVYDRLKGYSESLKDTILVDDGTEFREPATIGGSVTRNYTIRNHGSTDLNLTGAYPYVTVTGTNAADFSVTAAPAPTVPAGGATSFSISFTPGAAGTRLATVNIASDDADEAVYTFNVRGWQRTSREINIEGNGANIANGAATPNATDHTDFGEVSRVGAMQRDFMIENLGLDALHISNVSITGTHAADFSLTQAPRATLNGRESTLAGISFIPGGLGLREATVTVYNDDADESGYSFQIQGRGVDTIVTDLQQVDVPEGGTAGFGVKLSQAPASPVTVTVTLPAAAHLDAGISVQSSTTLAFDSGNWDTYQTVTLADAEDDTDTVSSDALVRLVADSADIVDGFVRATEIDNDTNARPLAQDQSVTVDEDCAIDITLKGSDGDTGAILNYTVLSGPDNGTLTGTPPALTYQGLQDYSGPDSLTFKVDDGIVDSAPGTVSITVTEIDDLLDTDGDGLPDGDEKCIYGTNPLSADSDNDGLSDGAEILTHGTNPLSADSDGDGMTDGWEVSGGLDPLVDDAAGDPDADGLTNADEFSHGSNPNNPDTDGDGLNDGAEVNVYGTSPTLSDTDEDHLSDGDEVNVYGTDPLSWVDTDLDGMADDWENVHGFDINDEADGQQDADYDGAVNYLEYYRDTDARSAVSKPDFRTIFVDAGGCDPGANPDGSAGNPYCSLLDGVAAAQGGDTVELAAGVHRTDNFQWSVYKPVRIEAASTAQASIACGYGTYVGFGSFSMTDIAWGGITGVTLDCDFGVMFSRVRNLQLTDITVGNVLYASNALTINSQSSATLLNSRIVDNNNTGIQIGGTSTRVDLVNVTLSGNTVGLNINANNVPTVTVKNSIVYGNTTEFGATIEPAWVSYSIVGDAAFDGVNGNIMADPLFVDAAGGDYRVQVGSPAVDAGDPADDYSAEPLPNGCRSNIGAEGNTATATVSSDTDGDGLYGVCALVNGNVDAVMADYLTKGAKATAVVVNRTNAICNYALTATDSSGNGLEVIATGTIAPNTARLISGKPVDGSSRWIQARIWQPGIAALEAVDTSWAP